MLKTVSSITNAIGALNYKGTWNASTNTPTLADGTGAKGDYYVVSTAGTQTFDGILLFFGAGDWIVYNGAVWQRVEGGSDGNFSNVTLNSTDAGATAGPLLDLYRNSASPAASDTIGEIEFNGKDSAGNKQQYALIHSSILSPTSTTEQGQIHFETATAGASTEKMIIGTTNLVINDIGAVFNVRIEGDTDANLIYTDATNDRVGVGTASPSVKFEVNGAAKASSLSLTTALPVASGGTNASTASITSFNNITGYTASGATGTTSTNLVFSTSPTITTPTINTTGAQVAIHNGYQSSVQNNGYQYDGRNYVTTTSGTLTKFASVTVENSTSMGRILIDVIASNVDSNAGYAIARSQRVVLFSKFGGTVTILNSTEQYNQIGSVNAGVIAIALVTSAAVNGNDIDLKATATATGAVGATNLAITSQVTVITGSFANTLTMV